MYRSYSSLILKITGAQKHGAVELCEGKLIDAPVSIMRITHYHEPQSPHLIKYDVVGPICESTDCFRKDVDLPESFRGDLVAIRTAGAYAEVMASRYNLRDEVQSIYSV